MQSVVSGTLTSGRSTIDIARDYTGTGSQDDVYDFTIKSVDKCSPNGGFNLPKPVAGHKCSDILYHAWKDCTLYRYSFPTVRTLTRYALFRQQPRPWWIYRRRLSHLQRFDKVLDCLKDASMYTIIDLYGLTEALTGAWECGSLPACQQAGIGLEGSECFTWKRVSFLRLLVNVDVHRRLHAGLINRCILLTECWF